MEYFRELIIIFFGLIVPALFFFLIFLKTRKPKRTFGSSLQIDQSALDAAEKELREQGEKDWIVLKRCHGPAYTHTAMSEIISHLASEGIEATYDVYGASSADMGVTNFMLKVLAKDEERAREVLNKSS
jgi:hypothetical protein